MVPISYHCRSCDQPVFVGEPHFETNLCEECEAEEKQENSPLSVAGLNSAPLSYLDVHLRAIERYYGDQRAERTGIPYIQHIYEGLIILDLIGASEAAKQAYCLHPIYQLKKNVIEIPIVGQKGYLFSATAVMYAKEYARVANNYLCKKHYKSEDDEVALSTMHEVNHMLIADKVQNRKDFEVYYESQEDKETFDRSENLSQYFKNWLKALDVSEEKYQWFKRILMGLKEGITVE